MNGMLRLNRWLTRLSRHGAFLLRLLMRLQFGAAFRAMMLDDPRSNSSTMPLAAAQDFALFASDWGFALAHIRTPVHFFQGSVDRNVPAQHAELMAGMVSGAVLHRYPGEGHFLVVPRLREILDTVFAAA